jgi:hypothetical protein
VRHCLAYYLGALSGEQRLVDLRFVRRRAVELVVLLGEYDPFVGG